MQIRVLGCSGGIRRGTATTSFLLDEDMLVDAGTGVADLTLEEMQKIRHVFVTHAHLDHIAALPLLADTLFDSLAGNPVNVYAQPPTIEALHRHIFNGCIWPDFTALPNKSSAVLKLNAMAAGGTIELDGRLVEMIPVNHTVPGVAYRVSSGRCSFAFSGDTTGNDSLWAALNEHDNLDLLFIESAFANRDMKLASAARHYCPRLLAADLAKLAHRPTVGISHLKPGEEQLIMDECRGALPGWDIRRLRGGDVFVL